MSDALEAHALEHFRAIDVGDGVRGAAAARRARGSRSHRAGPRPRAAAFLGHPRLVNVETKDLLFVLSALLALCGLARRPLEIWGLAVLVYVACMTFFVDQGHVYGWYFIPLYPWLCAALADSIARASRERHLGLSLLWCSVALVIMASCASDHQLWGRSELRFAYLALLMALYGAWSAWPRVANATLPAINGLCVAGVVAVCLFEVYLR